MNVRIYIGALIQVFLLCILIDLSGMCKLKYTCASYCRPRAYICELIYYLLPEVCFVHALLLSRSLCLYVRLCLSVLFSQSRVTSRSSNAVLIVRYLLSFSLKLETATLPAVT